VKDIESLRDERLGQISGQRRAAEAYIEGLHSRLNTLQTRALTYKPYNEKAGARRMPDDLAEDLMRALNEMRSQKTALAAKDAEETALRAQFQSDIDRYKELRSAVRVR
jgi:HD superfamily phosphohydrolase